MCAIINFIGEHWLEIIAELGKAFLSGLTIYFGIILTIKFSKKKENQERVQTLLLFNEIVKSIVSSVELEAPKLMELSISLKEKPAEFDNLIRVALNPDALRLQLINTHHVYEGFLIVYGDKKKEAILDYNQVNNLVLFLNKSLELLYKTHEEYQRSQKSELQSYIDKLDEFNGSVESLRAIIRNPRDQTIKDLFDGYIEDINTYPMDELHLKWVVPIQTELRNYMDEVFIPLVRATEKLGSIREGMIKESLGIASIIDAQLAILPVPKTAVLRVTKILDERIPKYLKN